jgi:hypothetical protein
MLDLTSYNFILIRKNCVYFFVYVVTNDSDIQTDFCNSWTS